MQDRNAGLPSVIMVGGKYYFDVSHHISNPCLVENDLRKIMSHPPKKSGKFTVSSQVLIAKNSLNNFGWSLHSQQEVKKEVVRDVDWLLQDAVASRNENSIHFAAVCARP